MKATVVFAVTAAIPCIQADLASSAASSRAAGPAAVFRVLATESFWQHDEPSGYRFGAVQSRPGPKSSGGDVVVSLKGRWAGQGLAFVVWGSAQRARAVMRSFVAANRAKLRLVSGTVGTYEWRSVDRGALSSCADPTIRCYAYARVRRVGNTVVSAVVGAARPNAAGPHAVAALLDFAVTALRRAGG
jgi:hypothetical protein